MYIKLVTQRMKYDLSFVKHMTNETFVLMSWKLDRRVPTNDGLCGMFHAPIKSFGQVITFPEGGVPWPLSEV